MDLFAQKFETIYIPKDIKNATTIKATNGVQNGTWER